MNNARAFPIPPLRWFLLGWVGIVYLGGLLEMKNVAVSVCPGQGQACSLHIELAQVSLAAVFTSTALFALFAALLWFSLSGGQGQRLLWLTLPGQALLVFALFLLGGQPYTVLSLYLALTLETIASFTQAARSFAVVAVACGYLLLSVAILSPLWREHGMSAALTWDAFLQYLPFLIAQVLFLAGYLLLYLQLARSHQQLQTAAMHIEVLTRLTERQRLARNLHDTLAQGLAGLVMQLEVANSHLQHQRAARGQELVQESIESARSTLIQARSAIDSLRAEMTNAAALDEQIQEAIRRFTTATGISCQTDLAALSLVPTSLYEPVLRTITEGLHNVAQHAHAQHVWVDLTACQDRLTVELRDDGKGFDPSSAQRTGHYGLLGLRERARMVGGQLEIESRPGAGTTLRVRLPLGKGGMSDA